MKHWWLIPVIILLVSGFSLPIFYYEYIEAEAEDSFFFGVSFGGNTTRQAKMLIDRVKGYTNFFLINSWDIATNETALNEVSQYAVEADMSFVVFFDFISRQYYGWHQTWLDTANERFGDKFLGVYLYDEPGGRQIDSGYWKGTMGTLVLSGEVADYSEAAENFVTQIGSLNSTKDVKSRNLRMFTSDYALYWFDYLAGYDTMFVELGWNNSRTQQIALGRGAAKVQDKEWGAIITWTYAHSPYIENGTLLLQDMITAYKAGAKYVVVFNYPHDQTFGILKDEHFDAMETFWDMTRSPQQDALKKVESEVALVLPKDYGWGMRNPGDVIWFPDWGPDELSPLIWNNMNRLIEEYGLKLDIIYNDARFDFEEKYLEIYYWDNEIS